MDLQGSGFAGQIPAEILQLSKLVYLNLELNSLKLQNPGLQSLVEKFPNIEELHLTEVDIYSTVPNNVANLTSLTSLALRGCGLHGEFPAGIFQLPNLEVLSVRYNADLTGYVPEFNRSSPLKLLMLGGTSFYGELPDSIGDLKLLNSIDVSDCNFSGPVPSSLGNLTELIYLDLSSNSFNRCTLDWIGKQTKLNELGLANLKLSSIPFFIRNLTQLVDLRLSNNGLHGSIPNWMWNLSKKSLQNLDLSNNFLTGFHQLPVILPWTNLRGLDLSNNKLQGSLPIPSPSIITYSVSNNTLTGEIPKMICNLSSLDALDLSYNNLSGMLPDCLGNLSFSLSFLNLRRNNFNGKIPQICKKGSRLQMIDFSQNQYRGRYQDRW